MPPGTDRESVKDSARAFAAAQFRNHQYVFASHEDERHPHVHLIVKAVAHDGIRLNPRKADLQLWRVRFAEQLRERGIEANATPRRARGVVKKAEKQAVHNIDLEFEQGKRDSPSLITKARKQAAEQEVKTGKKRNNPIQDNFSVARKGVEKVYGQIARTLSKGDAEDKTLALQIVDFVKQMPTVVTKHQQLVEDLRTAEARKQGVKTNEVEQVRAQPGDERTR
jgi:type III secretion system FlhB-like substrate exporter